MTFHSLAHSAFTLTAIGLLLAAAASDITSRLIPNAIPLALAAIGLAIRIADGGLLAGLAASSIVFAAAALCWRAGWLGGGDVKLLGAVALLVPPEDVVDLITTIAIAGSLLAALFLLARGRMKVPRARAGGVLSRITRIERWRLRRGGPLPYAVAIACGTGFLLTI
jgi:prepilin peptidase CpaA